KHGVPHYAILVTCGLLSISVVLNAIFKDATKVFVQITTFSTVLNIMIWTIIMIAYLGYLRHEPKQHKESNYKMWGGKYMAYCILGFFAFIFIILLINSATRYAVLSAPVWFVIMLVMYQKYKKESRKAKIETEEE
ncbi:MAG: gamma-aminobutyrate permease, partial [Staphylococcus epidermidis]|nr:gamma-aminobutyrate permease [Staphylococcus epidermidis]